jgi:hypothetical protein
MKKNQAISWENVFVAGKFDKELLYKMCEEHACMFLKFNSKKVTQFKNG